ncbi:MAG: DUF4347 domain-containing protein [Betaproteobacteria bacterium]|nr:DUF4347 domain-containing protein [Betaproteobacteria bacterium]
MSEEKKPKRPKTSVEKSTAERRPVRKRSRTKPRFLALEQRIVFDGALAADLVDKVAGSSTDAGIFDGTDGTAPAVDWIQTQTGKAAETTASAAAPADRAQDAAEKLAAAVDPNASSESAQGSEILFIDGGIRGLDQLLQGVRSGVEVVILDPSRDGYSQITQALSGRQGIEAIHLVSHGDPGRVALGDAVMTAQSLAEHADELAQWKASLSDGADFLIYGCDTGLGTGGDSLLNQLSDLTGVDAAASTDLTGGGPLGGDWDLEVSRGEVLTRPFADPDVLASFSGLLAAPVVDLNSPSTFVVSDSFATQSYTGGSNWATGWLEFDGAPSGGGNSDNSPTGANVRLVAASDGGYEARLVGHSDAPRDYLQRTVSLLPYTSASLSFTYRMQGIEADDVLTVNVSKDGGSTFTTVATLTNTLANTTRTIDLSGFIGDQVVIRFGSSSGFLEANDMFFFDNVAITADGNNYVNTYTENGVAVELAAATIAVVDPEGSQIAGATVTLNNARPGDTLSVGTLPAGITASVAGNVVTLSGLATGADYATALRAVTFASSSDTPNTTMRNFTIRVTDATGEQSLGSTAFVKVVAVDDTMVATADTYGTGAFVPVTGNVMTNDTDPDGSLSVDTTLVTEATKGTVVMAADGTFTYTPTSPGTYTDTFQYKLVSLAQVPGVTYEYWSAPPTGNSLATGFPSTPPTGTGYMTGYDVDQAAEDNGNAGLSNFTVRYTSTLEVTTAGTYTFYTGSDDGSMLYVNGALVVNNDGAHSFQEMNGTITLGPGIYTIRVDFFEVGGQEDLQVAYSGPDTAGARADLGAAVGVLAPTYATGTVTVNVVDAGPKLALGSDTAIYALDQFGSNSYSLDAGTFDFAGNWIEGSDNNSAGGGDLRVTSGYLRFRENDSTLSYVERSVDLLALSNGDPSRFGTTLTFNYSDVSGSSGSVAAKISADNGATWTTLGTFNTSSGTGTASYDISSYSSSTSKIRFESTAGGSLELRIDNVRVNTHEVNTSATFTEGGSAVAIASATTSISEPSPDTVSSATITLTNAQAGDQFTLGTLPGSITGVVSGNTVTLSGAGTQAQYAAALQQVFFSNTGDNPSAVDRVIEVTVKDASGNDSNTATTTVSVTPVNDAPLGIDNTVTTSAGNAYTVVLADFKYSDAENHALSNVTITSLPGVGSLKLNGVNVTVGQTISVANINAGQLKYTPSGTTTASFGFRVQDVGGTAGGGVNTDPVANTLTINVLASPAAPVVAGTDTLTYTENDAATAVSPTISVSDADNSTLTKATVSIGTGFVTGQDVLSFTNDGVTMGNISAAYNATTGVMTLTSSGSTATVAQWEAALRAVKYSNSSDNPSTADRTVTFNVQDPNSQTSNTVSSTVKVTSVNDLASIGGTIAGSTIEDTTTVATGTLTVTDPDGSTTVSLQSQTGTYGTFALVGNTWTYTLNNSSSAVQSLSGFSGGNDTLTVVSSDGVTRNITVSVTGVNDAPSGTDSTITTVKNATYTLSAADFGFTDAIDAGDSLLAVKITSLPSGGTLANNGVTVTTGQFVSASDIALGRLKYTAANNTTTRSFTFQVQDTGGTANGGVDLDSTANTLTITVNNANTAPTLSGSTVLSYVENGSAAVINGSIAVADDSPTLPSATVSITSGFVSGQDVLSFANDGVTMGNISASFDSGTGVMTLTSSGSTATLAQWQSALRAVKYANTSDAPSTTSRTVSFVANDGSLSSSAVTSTVNVGAVNDRIVLGGATSTLSYTENQSAQVIDSGITVSDPDSPASFNGGYLQVAITTNGAAQDQLSVLTVGAGPTQITTSGSNVTYGGVTVGTIDGALNGSGGQAIKITFNANARTAAVQALSRAIGLPTVRTIRAQPRAP